MIDDLLTSVNKLYCSCFRVISLFFVFFFFFYLSYIYVKHNSIITGYRNYYQISYTLKRLVSLTNN